MKKIFIFVVSVIISVSNLHAANDGKNVRYNGKTFEIEVFNQDVAEKEIASAKHVYAFQIAEFGLNQGNSDDNWDCLFNSATGEYAFTNYVKSEDKVTWIAIILSPNGARMIEFNPSTKDHLTGFDFVDPCTNEMGFVGYCTHVGYANASHNGVHNSVIVYIK